MLQYNIQYKIGTIIARTATENTSYKLSETCFNVFILDNGNGDRISFKSCPEDLILDVKDILSNKVKEYITTENGSILHI